MAIEAAAVGVKAPLVTSPIAFPAASATFMCGSRRGPAFELEANAQAASALGKLADNRVRARKSAFGPPALADGEGEPSLDRRGGFVHVLTVKRKARLKPQRIARAKPDGQDFGLREQCCARGFRRKPLARRFRTRPRRCSPTRDDLIRLRTSRGTFALSMKLSVSTPGIKRDRTAAALRPLQGEQRAVRLRRELNARRQPARDMRKIDLLARGVDNQREARRHPGCASPSDRRSMPPCGVQKLGVADASRLQAEDIGRRQRLDAPPPPFRNPARQSRAWPICETSKSPAAART